MQKVYDYLQKGRWFRLTSSVGTFSLGGCLYNATKRFAEKTLEITFDSETYKLTCFPEKSAEAFQLAIQALTKSALMGNTARLFSFSVGSSTLLTLIRLCETRQVIVVRPASQAKTPSASRGYCLPSSMLYM
jgi:hypothetical protein